MRSQLVFSGGRLLAGGKRTGEIHITHAKALAGNVTPGDPAGYPVVLSEPGTYQLADNLIVPLNKTGISITSPYVTVNLNGFTIQGGTRGLHGVYGAQHGVTIKNGTIVGFKLDGISGQGDYWIIENMRVIRNGRDGIHCKASCQVQNSISSRNGEQGIATWGGTVMGNTVLNNGNYGIFGWLDFTGSGNKHRRRQRGRPSGPPGPKPEPELLLPDRLLTGRRHRQAAALAVA